MVELLNDEQIAEIDGVIRDIYNEQYYTHLWEQIWGRKGMPLRAMTPAQGYGMFQDFWTALPDSSAIRHGPFFTVCDMAEKYCLLLADEYEDVGPMPDEAAF